MNTDERFKVVVLGEWGVGKSSIITRYVRNIFFHNTESTIGAAFFSISTHKNNKPISLDIWDTAGQERYATLAPMYYRKASAAIVVYDITSIETFEKAKKWITELHSCVNDCDIILVGNKVDLNTIRDVPQQIARIYAREKQIKFFEVSARSNTAIKDVFEQIINNLPSKKDNNSDSTLTNDIISNINNNSSTVVREVKSSKRSCKCKN